MMKRHKLIHNLNLNHKEPPLKATTQKTQLLMSKQQHTFPVHLIPNFPVRFCNNVHFRPHQPHQPPPQIPQPQQQPPHPQHEELIDTSSSSEDGSQPPPPKMMIPKSEEATLPTEEIQPPPSQTVVEVVNIYPTQEVIDLSSSPEEDR
ncbi:hypothetical protein PIB30_012926 [Stylosanthes scabra]|uniref:Uncharacterized protein n=1 Tax=Stylosanthes scabra TaxID=79078 RepID=A0ABU6Y4D8_9FABA|nr:hypothetical protein [Stylosanthes scabra]